MPRLLPLLGLITGCAGPGLPVARDYPAVAEWTTLDLAQLDNYADPILPLPYRDPSVTALDNSRAAPITDAGATLGRVLFFDPRLSVNNRIACASCHLPEAGFTDTAAFSIGHTGERLTVRTMRLGNARWYAGPGFLWDRRAPTLEAQATQPLVHPLEMGWDEASGGLAALRRKMAALPYYPELFHRAFGDDAITDLRIRRALAMYVRSILAVRSRWDLGYLQVYDAALPDRGLSRDVPGLTAQENLGRALFISRPEQGGFGCAACHLPPTFSLSADSKSNGLTAGETVIFKAPSLKNVAVTGPYMHNGMLESLPLAVAFYDGFALPGPALDDRLKGPGGTQRRLDMTDVEREAVVAFLHTLTDTSYLQDQRFRSPFRR